MASPFFGGPERQMLGLARHMPSGFRTTFLSFPEFGLANSFLAEADRRGLEAFALQHNAPYFWAAIREVADRIRQLHADVVCCSGYKPDVLGWGAGRLAGLPVVSVSHGWTAATLKVRVNECLDRLVLRWVDAVICVSAAQAEKVRRTGVTESKIHLIRNAIEATAFGPSAAEYRQKLLTLFRQPPRLVVGAAGRLSPEKNFALFVEAAARLAPELPDVAFVVFGEGPQRAALEHLVADRGLQGRFVLPGFRDDLGKWLPHLNVAVLSSTTEGLPVALLEMFAAGVPAVATAVGGVPEVLEDGRCGYLVPSGDAASLARRLRELLSDAIVRKRMGDNARDRVRAEFTFGEMSRRYAEVFRMVVLRQPMTP
jgi:glycosyltransferase involved in cell wall biosynthesis